MPQTLNSFNGAKPLRNFAMFFVTKEMIEEQPFQAFRNLLLVGLMLVIMSIALLVGLVHFYLTGAFINIAMNVLGALYLAGLTYSVYKSKQISWQPHAFVVLAFLYFPLYIHINQAQEYSLVWLLIVPFSMIAIMGRKQGLRYLTLFYIVIFFIAFQGIGVWDNGNWTEISFVRFTVASLLGVALALVIDVAQTGLNNRLKEQKKREKGYIEELKHMTIIDHLTNVYNRRHLNEVMSKRVKKFSRTSSHLSFFIIDIDYFKLFNDQFGHLAGDEVLIEVAQAIQNYIKRYDDFVFRLGGEEFGGIITTDDPQETAQWLAGLISVVENLKIKHAKEAELPFVTISMGVYSCKAKEIDNISDLYRAADEALYHAKNIGRNCAVVWDKKGCKEIKV